MLHITGPWIQDEHGRTLMLRGVNLGGSSKVPAHPNGATHIREGFFDHRHVSFVGRPFPLDEADEHFARLRAWGFTFLRFLVTWEAIEHAGPGLYDEAYLDYLYAVVKKAGEYGLMLFIDPHQDVWGRFSGGDGAPGWTYEAVGFDITHFAETGAAMVHAIHGDPFPHMVWFTNNDKLAAATMFTLFFGGNDFAPQTMIEGQPAQDFLQRHYIDAFKQVALRLKDLPHVVGYDTLNEPSAGFIGCPDLRVRSAVYTKGASPTPFQAMLLGAGYPQEVEVWDLRLTGMKRTGTYRMNPDGVRAWREGVTPLWQQNGVWDVDAAGQPHLLRPDYFARRGDRAVDFHRDYLKPFANRFAREIRHIDPAALIFVEGVPNAYELSWGAEDAANIVHAGHWYDGVTMMTRNFIPWLTLDPRTMKPAWGKKAVRKLLAAQLAEIKRVSAQAMGNIPTLIGEFGIPFDLQHKKAYRSGDFSSQALALDTTFAALEANLLNGTLWNYTADNDNVHGDQWNGEDFSIFSRDQQTGSGSLDDGGRALAAVVRPYPRAVAGEPLALTFSASDRVFEFTFRHDPAVTAPTECFIPNFQYPDGYAVEVSDGEYTVDRATQTLIYRHDPAQTGHWLRVGDARTSIPVAAEEQRRRRNMGLLLSGALAAIGWGVWRLLSRKKKPVLQDFVESK